MYPAEERREKGGTERERERRRRVVVKRWQCYHHQYVSRDTYRSRYTIYIYIYIRGLQTNEKVFTTGPALIISLALSFRGVRTHVSFLISAAISPSNDRPYKLQLLSSTSETPPPPPQEGRKEGTRGSCGSPLLLPVPFRLLVIAEKVYYSLSSSDKLRIEILEGDTIFQRDTRTEIAIIPVWQMASWSWKEKERKKGGGLIKFTSNYYTLDFHPRRNSVIIAKWGTKIRLKMIQFSRWIKVRERRVLERR